MIHVPNPCPVKWDAMTPQKGGRHCASCNKLIPDFTKSTEEEILLYMETTGQTCGRFRTEQVTDGQTYGGWQHYFRWKTAVSLLLLGSLFFTSCNKNAPKHTTGYRYMGAPKQSKSKSDKKAKWFAEPKTDMK